MTQNRRWQRVSVWLLMLGLLGFSCLWQGCILPHGPKGQLVTSLHRTIEVVEPRRDTPPRTLVARFRVVEAEGVSKELRGQTVSLAIQPPDRLRLALSIKGEKYELGRAGDDRHLKAALGQAARDVDLLHLRAAGERHPAAREQRVDVRRVETAATAPMHDRSG